MVYKSELTEVHNVCGLYMEQSENPALLARLSDHVEGRRFGGTALSNPMKAMAGIEPIQSKFACAIPYLYAPPAPEIMSIAPMSLTTIDIPMAQKGSDLPARRKSPEDLT